MRNYFLGEGVACFFSKSAVGGHRGLVCDVNLQPQQVRLGAPFKSTSALQLQKMSYGWIKCYLFFSFFFSFAHAHSLSEMSQFRSNHFSPDRLASMCRHSQWCAVIPHPFRHLTGGCVDGAAWQIH